MGTEMYMRPDLSHRRVGRRTKLPKCMPVAGTDSMYMKVRFSGRQAGRQAVRQSVTPKVSIHY